MEAYLLVLQAVGAATRACIGSGGASACSRLECGRGAGSLLSRVAPNLTFGRAFEARRRWGGCYAYLGKTGATFSGSSSACPCGGRERSEGAPVQSRGSNHTGRPIPPGRRLASDFSSTNALSRPVIYWSNPCCGKAEQAISVPRYSACRRRGRKGQAGSPATSVGSSKSCVKGGVCLPSLSSLWVSDIEDVQEGRNDA